MTKAVKSTTLSDEQISTWLRGLLSIAWADGHFDEEEKVLIHELTESELAPTIDLESFQPISSQELGQVLGQDPAIAENFLRTAVMVALADGIYSPSEDELLQELCTSLGVKVDALESLRHTLEDHQQETTRDDRPINSGVASSLEKPSHSGVDVLAPVRHWMDGWDIHDPRLARFLCKMIPPQCPFERDIKLFGHKIVHIPPMCKLNPLYEQLVGLRFRSLSYLADDCGEDISPYI
jgi:tellurite resistance protein